MIRSSLEKMWQTHPEMCFPDVLGVPQFSHSDSEHKQHKESVVVQGVADILESQRLPTMTRASHSAPKPLCPYF